YRLLETVRLYAQDRLVSAGEAAERRDAHRDWYLARIEELSIDDLFSAYLVIGLLPDLGNVRAAIDWTASQDRPDLLARLVIPSSVMWPLAPALVDETRRWLVAIGEDERLPAAVRADAFACAALAVVQSGDYEEIRPSAQRSMSLDD